MGEHTKALSQHFVDVPFSAIGRVQAAGPEGGLRVALDGRVVAARRATSCLVVPEAGDRVWLCGPELDALYIVAILDREGARPCELGLGEDARISASGRLTVTSQELVVHAQRATTVFDRMHSIGRELTASVGKVKMVGNLLESMFDRVAQFAGQSTRTVEGVDQLRTATLDVRATRSLSLQGSEVIATATTLMKVDGGQIHIG